ncbi:MAG: TatD family hydrolase [Patescibacteria group bacterium]
MLIDTHAHLNFKDFDDDREEIIKQCQKNDIVVLNIGVNYTTSKEVIELAEKYNNCWATVAVHPHDIAESRDGVGFDYNKFLELAKHSRVVGIGECGLDYQLIEADKRRLGTQIDAEKAQKQQQEIFIQHLKLAQEVDKPIIIHSRRLFPEILEIIKTFQASSIKHLNGVLHCYMGRWSYAEEYLKLGFYLSFTGLITYARDYDKVIKNCPLDRILIETDSPYLTPDPLRKKDEIVRNTPLNVELVARKIAEIKGISFEEVAEQTTKNAQKLFKIQ